jgi:hypothetical protein
VDRKGGDEVPTQKAAVRVGKFVEPHFLGVSAIEPKLLNLFRKKEGI